MNVVANPAPTSSVAPTAAELKTRFSKIETRVSVLAESLEFVAQVKRQDEAAQEGFLLATSDCQLLQKLAESTKESIGGIYLLHQTQEELDSAGYVAQRMATVVKRAAAELCKAYGVSEEVLRATSIKDMVRTLDLMDALLARAEQSVSAIG